MSATIYLLNRRKKRSKMMKEIKLTKWSKEGLDLFTLIEPLACVQHSYQRLPETLRIRSACVFGAGPIGSLHLIELRRRFPGVDLSVVEPSNERRNLVQLLFNEVQIVDSHAVRAFDLVIVANSDPQSNLDTIASTRAGGIVVHFSGLNHQNRDGLVFFEGIDIERLHRHEEIRVLQNGTRLIGSSGYSKVDIRRAIESLVETPEDYQCVQTAVVDGIGSNRIKSRVSAGSKSYFQSAIETLLKNEAEYLSQLKVVFRTDGDQDALKISPRKEAQGYSAILKKQTLPEQIPDGFVRVRVLRFSICNTDRRVLSGKKSANLTEDLCLGHEGLGIVIGKGRGIDTDISCQDLSLILPHFYDEQDPQEISGTPYLSPTLKHLGIHLDGCFATVVDVPAGCVFSIDDALPHLASIIPFPRGSEWSVA